MSALLAKVYKTLGYEPLLQKIVPQNDIGKITAVGAAVNLKC